MQWMVKEVIHNNKNKFLATKLQSSITIWAVSNGSYHPTYQYWISVWIIKIQNNDRLITGANIVLGDAKSQHSHCSDLCGLIGAIRHINKTCSTYNVLEGSTDLGYNGLEAYKVATRYAYTPCTKLSHYYLSYNLHKSIKEIPLSWKF